MFKHQALESTERASVTCCVVMAGMPAASFLVPSALAPAPGKAWGVFPLATSAGASAMVSSVASASGSVSASAAVRAAAAASAAARMASASSNWCLCGTRNNERRCTHGWPDRR